jgi:hypothetical protein
VLVTRFTRSKVLVALFDPLVPFYFIRFAFVILNIQRTGNFGKYLYEKNVRIIVDVFVYRYITS